MQVTEVRLEEVVQTSCFEATCGEELRNGQRAGESLLDGARTFRRSIEEPPFPGAGGCGLRACGGRLRSGQRTVSGAEQNGWL